MLEKDIRVEFRNNTIGGEEITKNYKIEYTKDSVVVTSYREAYDAKPASCTDCESVIVYPTANQSYESGIIRNERQSDRDIDIIMREMPILYWYYAFGYDDDIINERVNDIDEPNLEEHGFEFDKNYCFF